MSYDSEIKNMQQHVEELRTMFPELVPDALSASMSVEHLCHLVCEEARNSLASGRSRQVVLQTDYYHPQGDRPGWIAVHTYSPFIILTAELE